MKLDPVSLRLFVSVLEEGTITAAAAREHIAAAAISRRLSDLEQALKSPLLIRTNKGITATPAGLSLLYMSRKLLNNINDIYSQIQEFSNGRGGSVHILANISAITQFIPDMLKTFVEKYPLIHINLEEKTSWTITQNIGEGKADIGIFTKLPYGSDIKAYPFRKDRLVVLVPLDHPLASLQKVRFHDTLDYEYISLYGGTHLHYQLTKAASENNMHIKLRTEVTSYDAMCLLINAGMGLGILPEESARIYRIKNTRMIELDEPWASRDILLCVKKSQQSLLPTAQLMLDHLLEAAQPRTQ